MDTRPLGRTGLSVTSLCLGSMTWGRQNSEAEAHAQMDAAMAFGINCIDTAEMYAVPPSPESQGLTEQYIGSWLAARGARDRVILMTKVIGPARSITWIRGGEQKLNRAQITQALDGSLRRLRTDYVDLYQIHWPERRTNRFGQLGYVHDPDDTSTDIAEQLDVLDDLVRAGKIRAIGLSNETPWGVARFLHLAETQGKARIVSVQNAYNLLNRTYEVGLAEISIREQCGLLAYSPLARGVLTGKYLDGQLPPGSWRTVDTRPSRYLSDKCEKATRAYLQIARDHGLSIAQMAIAFCVAQPFVTSAIIGATSLEQLNENLGAADVTLSAEVLEAIEAVHQDIPNPAP